MTTESPPLDFAALLSRNKKYKPATITQIKPQEALKDLSERQQQNQLQRQRSDRANGKASRDRRSEDAESVFPHLIHSSGAEEARKASVLAYKLSLRTREHQGNGSDNLVKGDKDSLDKDISTYVHMIGLDDRMTLEIRRQNNERNLPCELHPVELGDWESKINWEGVPLDHGAAVNGGSTTAKIGVGDNGVPGNDAIVTSASAQLILSETYNPFLEAMDLDNLISWEGANAAPGVNEQLAQRTGRLILEDGVAGLSIATKSSGITKSNPTPFNQSDVYKRRMERLQPGSSGSARVGGLQKKAVEEREIQDRQKRRAKMAILKKDRIEIARSKLNLGGGVGRAITSSLMGPGGTERTGRPSRQNFTSLAHDLDHVEQLVFINNHKIVKADLTLQELRHYHRPLLPQKIFKAGEIMPWQFQMQLASNSNLLAKRKGGRGGLGRYGPTHVSSVMNVIPGALSQAKILSGSDLTPTEGSLILVEYCEERPPIQLTKGMASKIVNFYRGDRSKCPVSAGGGDRPIRKKKHGNQEKDRSSLNGSTGKIERPPRLKGPNAQNEQVMDLIGKIPTKKKIDEHHGSNKDPKVTMISEGVTEILHAKDHGPFIGAVKDGVTQSGLISNLFSAPLFCHEPKSTDFLLILGKVPSKHQSGNGAAKLPVVIRPMPKNIFCVGQIEPKVKVSANAEREREFFTNFSTFQIAKALQNKQKKENCGFKIEEIKDRLFPRTEVFTNTTHLRQRIKKVARYDKNTQFYTLKEIGEDDFQGVEALGKKFSPEGVAAYWTSRVAVQRLQDLGIYELPHMTNSVSNIAAAMKYINGIKNTAFKRLSMLKKAAKNQSKTDKQALFEKTIQKLEAKYEELKRKAKIANFIYEEIQLAPWHLTTDFIEIHKKGGGSGMMKLTGLGDPSGLDQGFNFLREIDGKANKTRPNGDGALDDRVKKITGTNNDLRKLNMKQMASILKSYNMKQKDINELKRWDRVHLIRDLSTKAASDNMSDGLERFARGEKIKLSDQKKIYSKRIQEVWERQRMALSMDPGDHDVARGTGFGRSGEDGVEDDGTEKMEDNQGDKDDEDDEEDEDFMNDMEHMFENEKETNEVVNKSGDTEGFGAHTMKNSGDFEEAKKLLSFQQDRARARADAKDNNAVLLQEANANKHGDYSAMIDRKVLRRRITKTHPDGTQTVTFKFIVQHDEIKKAKLKKNSQGNTKDVGKPKRKKKMTTYSAPVLRKESKHPVGHALFEEEGDDGARSYSHVRRRASRSGRKTDDDDYSPTRRKTYSLKPKRSGPEKKMKRKRSEDEMELSVNSAKRKGTSNRKDRGAARDRMPHVIFADRLEQIRLGCEKRETSTAFHRPVDKSYNVYYEKIKNPMDLQTIKNKIQKYEYKTAQQFLDDFALMKDNAIHFNGATHFCGIEGAAIYDFVRATVEENRNEFREMEIALEEQMNSGPRRGSRASTPKLQTKEKIGKTANVTLDGFTTQVNLGDLQGPFQGSHTDADD